ncbi:MAG: hypothetical protein RLY35_1647 [Bacteroidota bacterium]|jgi:hypothetical protein
MVKKHILILNWQFPPNRGIGGRRCAKLAQEWKAMGHEITVITQQPTTPSSEPNQWIQPETQKAFEYRFVAATNRFNALYFQSGLVNALLLRLGKIYHRIFTKGNPIDDTRFASRSIMQALEETHHQKKIDLLFVSSAPFSLSLYACRFKQQHPEILVWCDFRDPWKNAINYGLQMLSTRQREDEHSFQREVGILADYVSAPYEEILDEFEMELGTNKKVLIPHFTDREVIDTPCAFNNQQPVLTYAGNWYEGAMTYVEETFGALNKLNEQDQPIIQFIGQFNLALQSALKSKYSKLVFLPWMDQGLDEVLMKSDGIIILLSEHNQNFHTTKFYDYLPFGKPYFYIGPMGKVAHTIQDKKIGCLLTQYQPHFWEHYQSEPAHHMVKAFSAKKMATKIIEHAFAK